MVSTRSYHNCCTVEKLVMQQLAKPLTPSELAALARALDSILERKRIMKGKPLPGSLKPTERKRSKRVTTGNEVASVDVEEPVAAVPTVAAVGDLTTTAPTTSETTATSTVVAPTTLAPTSTAELLAATPAPTTPSQAQAAQAA